MSRMPRITSTSNKKKAYFYKYVYLSFREYDGLPGLLTADGAILSDGSLQYHQNAEVQYIDEGPRCHHG